jgi:hypothetical protein
VEAKLGMAVSGVAALALISANAESKTVAIFVEAGFGILQSPMSSDNRHGNGVVECWKI